MKIFWMILVFILNEMLYMRARALRLLISALRVDSQQAQVVQATSDHSNGVAHGRGLDSERVFEHPYPLDAAIGVFNDNSS